MASGYDPPLRKDRADGYGEVMITIMTALTAEQLMIPTPCEMVAVKLETSKIPLIVVAIYKPTDNNTEYLTSMCEATSSIARMYVSKRQYTKQINEHFLDTYSMLGLSQMVTFATRIVNTLDIFLTNRPSLVNRCEPILGLVTMM